MKQPRWLKIISARWSTDPLKKGLKKAYLSLQPYDGPTLFTTRGPSRCQLISEVAKAAGGYHTTLRKGDTYSFPLPKSNHPAIAAFFAQYASGEYPPITVSEIPGGRIYANGVVLSPDGTTLARDLSLDYTHPFESHYLLNRPIHRSQSLKGRVLSVASWQTHSYYHWLLDELPRYLLSNLPDYDQVVCSRKTSAYQAAIEHLGLDKKPIVFLDRIKHYQCDVLIVPSYVSTTGQPSPYLVERLTQAVTPLIKDSASYPEKIFISRQLAGLRRIVNEDALFQNLEPYGFTRVRLEDFSWQDQINLFYHAREIISPHGAGLANLVFCAQKPLVIELFNANYMHWCFWQLATLVGANYQPFAFPRAGKVQQIPSAGALDIEISDISSFLEAYRYFS
ncbi:MAG: glycosyltransferase family 61 protein [Spirulina sp.]